MTLYIECPKCGATGWKDGCAHGSYDMVKHVTDCGSHKVWDCPKFVELEIDYEAAFEYLRRVGWTIPEDALRNAVDIALEEK